LLIVTVALLIREAPGFEGRKQMTVTAGHSTVSHTGESLTMTVGEFLLRRIREAGVGHARLNGRAALIVTNAVGALSAPTAFVTVSAPMPFSRA
jgi:hypothetical protein